MVHLADENHLPVLARKRQNVAVLGKDDVRRCRTAIFLYAGVRKSVAADRTRYRYVGLFFGLRPDALIKRASAGFEQRADLRFNRISQADGLRSDNITKPGADTFGDIPDKLCDLFG